MVFHVVGTTTLIVISTDQNRKGDANIIVLFSIFNVLLTCVLRSIPRSSSHHALENNDLQRAMDVLEDVEALSEHQRKKWKLAR